MARVARMPHVYYDHAKKRYFVERRVPDDVQAIVGKRKRKHVFPQSVDQAAANALASDIVKAWEAEWDAARPVKLVTVTIPARPFGRYRIFDTIAMEGDCGITRAELLRRLNNAYGEKKIEMPAAEAAEWEAQRRAAAAKPAEAHPVYRYEDCIRKLWVAARRRAGKSVSEDTIRKLIGSKVVRLVEHLGHDDMERVSHDDLENYFDTKFDGAATGTIRDHIIQIKSLFSLAHGRGRITHNPAKPLWYSKQNDNPGRPFLTSERTAIIRAAWACEDDTIKWLWLLASVYGPRIAEFAEASLRDVVIEDEIPVIYLDTLYRTGAEKTLKTSESRRWVPLHSAFRSAFMSRVEHLRREHGQDAPLFPDLKVYAGRRNKDASKRVNAWLDGLVAAKAITITDAENKSYHSLRHTVSTALKGRKWADFITGHAARSIKAKVYEHPPLDEVVADIETLEFP